MAAAPRFYRKYIATGNGFLFFAILYAILIRCFYFLNFGAPVTSNGENYLWDPIADWFNNGYISLACSSIIVAIIALLAAHINNKYLLIRQKTLLPSAFIILLFSSQPSFICMSGEFISALITVFILSMLFASYNIERKQDIAFQASFMLALSSLFSISAIIYLPILWVGMAVMRSFNFRAFLASILGIFIIYFPAFSWFLLTDQLQDFLNPFTNTFTSNFSTIPILSYNINEWVILACGLLLLLITISDYYINRHKDKIRVRNYFNLLFTLVVYTFIIFLFLNINSYLHLFAIFAAGSFMLSHFFALVETRSGSIFFYFVLLIYLAVSLSPFFLVE